MVSRLRSSYPLLGEFEDGPGQSIEVDFLSPLGNNPNVRLT